MKCYRTLTIATALAIAVLLAPTRGRADEKKDIVDTAVAANSFKTLAAALKAADLVDALKGPGPFTVFAPTDEAFAKLPVGTVENLLRPENKDQLAAVLKYHVVSGAVLAKQVVSINGAKTLNGQRVDIKVAGSRVTLDKSGVIATDVRCSNGIIHVIDAVMLPANDDIVVTAGKAGTFKTLLAGAKAAGLAETLKGKGPFTLFAPHDDAFAKLPDGTIASLLKPENKSRLAAILKYHIVSGRVYSEDARAVKKAKTIEGSVVRISAPDGKARINNAKLLTSDLDASNGVIHVIDRVLLPHKSND